MSVLLHRILQVADISQKASILCAANAEFEYERVVAKLGLGMTTALDPHLRNPGREARAAIIRSNTTNESEILKRVSEAYRLCRRSGFSDTAKALLDLKQELLIAALNAANREAVILGFHLNDGEDVP